MGSSTTQVSTLLTPNMANRHLPPPPHSKPILKEFSYITAVVVEIMIRTEEYVEFLATTTSYVPNVPDSRDSTGRIMGILQST
jgi:hypothetical protein